MKRAINFKPRKEINELLEIKNHNNETNEKCSEMSLVIYKYSEIKTKDQRSLMKG